MIKLINWRASRTFSIPSGYFVLPEWFSGDSLSTRGISLLVWLVNLHENPKGFSSYTKDSQPSAGDSRLPLKEIFKRSKNLCWTQRNWINGRLTYLNLKWHVVFSVLTLCAIAEDFPDGGANPKRTGAPTYNAANLSWKLHENDAVVLWRETERPVIITQTLMMCPFQQVLKEESPHFYEPLQSLTKVYVVLHNQDLIN